MKTSGLITTPSWIPCALQGYRDKEYRTEPDMQGILYQARKLYKNMSTDNIVLICILRIGSNVTADCTHALVLSSLPWNHDLLYPARMQHNRRSTSIIVYAMSEVRQST